MARGPAASRRNSESGGRRGSGQLHRSGHTFQVGSWRSEVKNAEEQGS